MCVHIPVDRYICVQVEINHLVVSVYIYIYKNNGKDFNKCTKIYPICTYIVGKSVLKYIKYVHTLQASLY